MKIIARALVVSMALFVFVGGAYALDDPPVDSGFILWVAPQIHVHDFFGGIDMEDDVGSRTLKADSDFGLSPSGGMGLRASYITNSPLFFAAEITHQVFLQRADREDFEDFEAMNSDPKNDNQVNFRIKSTRAGLLAGAYFMPAPFRPYVMLGGGVNQEELSIFGQDFEVLAFNGSFLAGGDFFISKHIALGTGLRVDYLFGETFEGDFEFAGDDHSATVTIDRMPVFWDFKVGYMF